MDDVLILITLEPIDGAGSVLGAAGPCFIRNGTRLPVAGLMKFDTADLDVLESGGLLQVVILHEMGHVLGFGTIWSDLNLLADPSLSGGTDPHFTGAQAIAAFDDIGGANYIASAKVPVEDMGGEGTADAHWRESVFGNELMTGFVEASTNALSRVSVASMADLGYAVNLAGADPFTLAPGLRAFSPRGPRVQLKNDLLRLPLRVVDEGGRSRQHRPAVSAWRRGQSRCSHDGGLPLGQARSPAGHRSMPAAHRLPAPDGNRRGSRRGIPPSPHRHVGRERGPVRSRASFDSRRSRIRLARAVVVLGVRDTTSELSARGHQRPRPGRARCRARPGDLTADDPEAPGVLVIERHPAHEDAGAEIMLRLGVRRQPAWAWCATMAATSR